MTTLMPGYPVHLDFRGDNHIHRWRPLVQWLLVIPQAIVASGLATVRGGLTIVAFFTVLVNETIPRQLFDLMVMTYRYEWRVNSYALFMREDYPPFAFDVSNEDTSGDEATVSIDYPQHLRRWMPLVKWFLVIPHLFVLALLGIAAFVAVVIGFFAVLFTGRYPEGLRSYLVGVYRWSVRVQAYAGLLTDDYPPFSMRA